MAKYSAKSTCEVDWYETPEAHTFIVNVPGYKTNDITVRLVDADRTLEIFGDAKSKSYMMGNIVCGTWHLLERPVGAFFRRFPLPLDSDVLGDKVTASNEDGILIITLPKKHQIWKVKVTSCL